MVRARQLCLIKALHRNRSAAGSIPARDLNLHFSLLFLGRSNNVYKFPSLIISTLQLGGGGGADVCAPPSPGQVGAGSAIFHDKQKIIRDKMRFSNLSNNMMISEQ